MAKKKLRTNHLLAIGIDRYLHDVPELQNAVSDAKAFVQLLQTEYQFTPENTTTLYNKEATKDNILSTFDHLIDTLTEEDTLTIYFSGHGEFKKRTKSGYWLPVESKLTKRGTYLSNDEVTKFLRATDAYHVFTVVDACFSGALFRKVSRSQTRLDNFKSRWLLTAGRNEPVLDGFESSPFAESLLSYLKSTNSEFITAAELCHEVVQGVLYNAEEQTPRGEPLYNVGHQGGQFIFYKKEITVSATDTIKIQPAGNTKSVREEVPPKVDPAPTLTPTPPVKAQPYESLGALKATLKAAADDIPQVLELLNKSVKVDGRRGDELILLRSQYKALAEQQRLGTLSFEQNGLRSRQLLSSILSLINILKAVDIKEGVIVSSTNDITTLEREAMSNMEKLMVQKINFLEKKLLLETDASVQFKLQYEIKEWKEKLEGLRRN